MNSAVKAVGLQTNIRRWKRFRVKSSQDSLGETFGRQIDNITSKSKVKKKEKCAKKYMDLLTAAKTIRVLSR